MAKLEMTRTMSIINMAKLIISKVNKAKLTNG
jgi:hypothetical protein